MKKYLSITIGPIYKTITQARSTREIWASSYIFSMLMKEILTVLKNEDYGEILNPTLVDSETNQGVGIYPDRCHLKLKKDLTSDDVGNLREKALEALPFWTLEQKMKYFQIYVVQTEYDDSGGTNVLQHLNQIMDNMELQQKFQQSGELNIMKRLKDPTIQKLYKKVRLPSLVEICNQEYGGSEYFNLLHPKKENVIEEESALKNFKEAIGASFKTRNKYFAIVQADGDGIGTKIQSRRSSEISAFSKDLFEFSSAAASIINEFGALPIYIGGDDMFFVAPLVNKEGKTLFHLINSLDKSFEKVGTDVTMSYGVSIGYYKYPMGEVMKNAYEQLNFGAKKLIIGDKKKNAVAFLVRKHSGQEFGTILPKGTDAYRQFISMTESHHNQLEESFLSSLIHTLMEHRFLLNKALEKGTEEHFFKHHFNEAPHSKQEDYINSVKELARKIFDDMKGVEPSCGWNAYVKPNKKKPNKKKEKLEEYEVLSNVLYSCLRMIQFLNAKDHD